MRGLPGPHPAPGPEIAKDADHDHCPPDHIADPRPAFLLMIVRARRSMATASIKQRLYLALPVACALFLYLVCALLKPEWFQ